jgi:hypothetical protein
MSTPDLFGLVFSEGWAQKQVAEKHVLFRLLKNVQMQGTRNSEE